VRFAKSSLLLGKALELPPAEPIVEERLVRLTDIFQSKAQTKLVEYMLENRSKVFNQSTLARFLDCSPSTVARIIEPLIAARIITYERFNQGMKVLSLNIDDERTKLLLEFHEKLKSL